MGDKAVAIRVDSVSKNFDLPQEKVDSLKAAFVGMFKRHDENIHTLHALKSISFDVKKGEFFGIVGRNGSGKSTLLKLLANIYQPTKGAINVNGKLVPFIELGVGFNPELSGRENIFLNGAMLGFSKAEVSAMYTDIVEFAELEPFMDQKLKNYSSGMQVRLAFSMATRSKADILLIDEVLAVGDADFQRKCYEYFNQLKRAKTTVVFVSHDMDAIQRYCDRSLILEKNEVKLIGDTRKVAESYTRLFIDQKKKVNDEKENPNRWGDGKFIINKVKVTTGESKVNIIVIATAKEDLEFPSAGIRIRSSAGQPITGTSTEFEGKTIPNLKSGRSVELGWSLPNIFSDGNYYVDSALSHGAGKNIADWWDESSQFNIKKKRLLPYPIDPKFDLKIRTMQQ